MCDNNSSGWPSVHSREGFGADGLEGSRFGLFCCGWHDFVLGLHVSGVCLCFLIVFLITAYQC
jgi:hypothetical protein